MSTKWQLKRNDNNAILELHEQFDWADEYDWTPLAQSDPVYTLSGSQIIQQSTKKAGRPITLDGTHTRTSRADIEKIQAWASVPKLKMTLTHPKGQEYQVIFARPFITDLDGKKFKPADQRGNDKLKVNVCLITV